MSYKYALKVGVSFLMLSTGIGMRLSVLSPSILIVIHLLFPPSLVIQELGVETVPEATTKSRLVFSRGHLRTQTRGPGGLRA